MKSIKEKNIKWWIGIISCSMLFIIIGIFAYTKMCFITKGVEIKVTTEKMSEDSDILIIEGTAKKATMLSINDREIFINKNGYFREIVSPLQGYSIISLKAKDKFGNQTEKEFQLLEKENTKSLVLGPSN